MLANHAAVIEKHISEDLLPGRAREQAVARASEVLARFELRRSVEGLVAATESAKERANGRHEAAASQLAKLMHVASACMTMSVEGAVRHLRTHAAHDGILRGLLQWVGHVYKESSREQLLQRLEKAREERARAMEERKDDGSGEGDSSGQGPLWRPAYLHGGGDGETSRVGEAREARAKDSLASLRVLAPLLRFLFASEAAAAATEPEERVLASLVAEVERSALVPVLRAAFLHDDPCFVADHAAEYRLLLQVTELLASSPRLRHLVGPLPESSLSVAASLERLVEVREDLREDEVEQLREEQGEAVDAALEAGRDLCDVVLAGAGLAPTVAKGKGVGKGAGGRSRRGWRLGELIRRIFSCGGRPEVEEERKTGTAAKTSKTGAARTHTARAAAPARVAGAPSLLLTQLSRALERAATAARAEEERATTAKVVRAATSGKGKASKSKGGRRKAAARRAAAAAVKQRRGAEKQVDERFTEMARAMVAERTLEVAQEEALRRFLSELLPRVMERVREVAGAVAAAAAAGAGRERQDSEEGASSDGEEKEAEVAAAPEVAADEVEVTVEASVPAAVPEAAVAAVAVEEEAAAGDESEDEVEESKSEPVAAAAGAGAGAGSDTSAPTGPRPELLLLEFDEARAMARYEAELGSELFGSMDMRGEGGSGYAHNYASQLSSESAAGTRDRRLRRELRTLKRMLPLHFGSTIVVRMDETRPQMLKAVIAAPTQTPYDSGCFEFDIYVPPGYPSTPPKVNLMTTGGGRVRFSPNLYNCGKVCLSLLGTWSGPGWDPKSSNLWQVLISIQSAILGAEFPAYNEPGFEHQFGTEEGKRFQRTCSNGGFEYLRVATLQWAIVDQLRHPSKGFERFIRRHLWLKRHHIARVVAGWVHEATVSDTPAHMAALVEQQEAFYAAVVEVGAAEGLGTEEEIAEFRAVLDAIRDAKAQRTAWVESCLFSVNESERQRAAERRAQAEAKAAAQAAKAAAKAASKAAAKAAKAMEAETSSVLVLKLAKLLGPEWASHVVALSQGPQPALVKAFKMKQVGVPAGAVAIELGKASLPLGLAEVNEAEFNEAVALAKAHLCIPGGVFEEEDVDCGNWLGDLFGEEDEE